MEEKISLGAKPIVFPAPVFIIGTYDKENQANAMTASWGGICCSKPPCIAVSLREATYTYGNIMERKAFTINIPSVDYVREADYFGLVSGRDEDKIKKAGLTTQKSSLVDAPYIKEFPLIIELSLLKTVEIGLHTQFIGEVKDIKVNKAVIDESGSIDIEKLMPFSFTPDIRKYYQLGSFLGKAFSIGKELKK